MEITENKLKEILVEQREEFQRFNDTQKKEFFHFMGIMKEDNQSNIQLITEQYHDIKDDLSIIKTDIQYLRVHEGKSAWSQKGL